jgi:hypothetical protein
MRVLSRETLCSRPWSYGVSRYRSACSLYRSLLRLRNPESNVTSKKSLSVRLWLLQLDLGKDSRPAATPLQDDTRLVSSRELTPSATVRYMEQRLD